MIEIAQPKYDVIKYKTPTGTTLNCKGWIQEAALRMLLNNLDPEVAERPEELIVYGGRGKAARNFECLDRIILALKDLENDETLLVQSGKPVGILKTHKDAPRVLISNSQLVPNWATWEHFTELEKKGFEKFHHEFIVTDSMLDNLMAAGKRNNVAPDYKDLAKNKSIIQLHVKAQIARKIWKNDGFFPIFNETNEILKQAVKLFDRIPDLKRRAM